MKRIAFTTAPHPVTGYDAYLEIFDAGQDTVMRCTYTEPRTGRDAIIYAGQHPDMVIRATGLFWTLDADTPPPAPIEITAIARAKASIEPPATVTVYDDGSGRALLQRVGDGPDALTVTWKSPEYDPAEWIEINGELEWEDIDPRRPEQATPAKPATIVDAEGYTSDPDHVHFQATKTTMGWAITYQDAPRSKGSTDNGGTQSRRTSLRFPLLVAGEWVEDGEDVCKAAAAILERNKAEMGAK